MKKKIISQPKLNFDKPIVRQDRPVRITDFIPLKDLWKWAGPILQKKQDQPNSLICLKGGDLHQEIFESGLRPKMMSIHDIFQEAYFEEKFIIQVKKP